MNNKVKVSLLVLDFLEYSGATRINQEIVNNPENKRYVLLSGVFNPIDSVEREFNKVDRIKFKINYKDRTSYYLSVFWGTFIKSFEALRKFNINRVVLNLPYSALAIILNPLYWHIDKTYIFHGAWDMENFVLTEKFPVSSGHPVYKTPGIGINKRLKFFIHYHVQWLCLKYSQNIVAYSRYSKDIVCKYFNIDRNKVHVLNPPIISKRRKGIGKKRIASIKQKYTDSDDDVLFLAPSRLDARKGIHLLVDAVKILRDLTKKKFKVLITGDVGLNESYALKIFNSCRENELFSYINFISVVDRERKLYELYQVSDCVIMPSIDLETLGLVTLESLSFGTPVMGFRTGSTPEILSKFNSRFIINKVSAKAIAHKMCWYINIPLKQKRLFKVEALNAYKNDILSLNNDNFY